MTALYREFTLHAPYVWESLKAFVKANAGACVQRDKPLRIIVTEADRKRNSEQNARLWGYLYKTISEQAWVQGKQYIKDVWHEYYARKFGLCEEMTLPDGEIITRRKSTTEMTVSEFADYMTHIEIDAAQELGIEWQ